MTTICDGANASIASHGTDCGPCGAATEYACGTGGVPAAYPSAGDAALGATIRPPPAATCQVLVPSGFDASGGNSSQSWPASQARSASYWRCAAVSKTAAACSGWSGATTSMRPIIVGPSTSLMM